MITSSIVSVIARFGSDQAADNGQLRTDLADRINFRIPEFDRGHQPQVAWPIGEWNIQNHAPMAKVLASNRARRKCLCKLQSFPL